MLLTCNLAHPPTVINVPLYTARSNIFTRSSVAVVLLYVYPAQKLFSLSNPPAGRRSARHRVAHPTHCLRRTKGCDGRRGHTTHSHNTLGPVEVYCGTTARDPRPRSAFARVTPCLSPAKLLLVFQTHHAPLLASRPPTRPPLLLSHFCTHHGQRVRPRLRALNMGAMP